MKKKCYILFLLFSVLFLLAGILGPLIINFIRPIQYSRKIQREPERIISTAPNLTEILFALGLDKQIIAVSDNCDYPPKAMNKPKIGTFFNPGKETIVSYKPDLVISLWFAEQKRIAESLNHLGIDVVTIKLEKLNELIPAIERIGKATNRQKQAKQISEKISSQIEQTRLNYAGKERPKILFVVQKEPLRVAGTKTFINQLIELAGGQNTIGPTPMMYPQMGSENLFLCDAEVIIHSAMNKENMEKEEQTAKQFWEKYPELPAVKNNRIYVIDPDTTLRLGPRLPDGIELIASLIHSDKK